jgi:hypothetical protein
MNAKILPVLALALGASLIPIARADVGVSISADIRLGHALPPPPPDLVVIEQVGPPGPPPWAASRWFRRSHAYYYYPGFDVYYRPDTRVWFYLEGGSWRMNSRLPDAIPIDFGRAVSLSLETDKPYAFHPDVVRYYPANYFAKVKFRETPHGHPDGPDKRESGGGGKGKSHGKDKRH